MDTYTDVASAAMVVKTIAMCVQTVVMFVGLVAFVVISRRARYNSPLEVKRRAALKRLEDYEKEMKAKFNGRSDH